VGVPLSPSCVRLAPFFGVLGLRSEDPEDVSISLSLKYQQDGWGQGSGFSCHSGTNIFQKHMNGICNQQNNSFSTRIAVDANRGVSVCAFACSHIGFA
jgi:hypothetical protein